MGKAKSSKNSDQGNSDLTMSSLLDNLREGTDFVPIDESDAMHAKLKTETPILALNCILGGGLPLGCIVEGFGVPTSGKSSVFYQTMGIFMDRYPHGVAIIIDTESSVDKQRMKYMGVDSHRVLRLPANTLEHGFNQMLKILEKKAKSTDPEIKDIPVFIIWDTIAIAATEAQVETQSVHGGGMAEKARLTKNYLSIIMPHIERHNVLLVLLNQVMSKIGAFRPMTESGGGWGLKHDQHLQLEFKSGKTTYDGIFAVEKETAINITKSKLSSLFSGLSVFIDIKNAGTVDVEKSFLEYLFSADVKILNAGAWSSAPYLLERYPEESAKFPILQKSFRKDDLIEYARHNKAFLNLAQVAFIDLLSDMYSYQKDVCQDYRDQLYLTVQEAEKDSSFVSVPAGDIDSEEVSASVVDNSEGLDPLSMPDDEE